MKVCNSNFRENPNFGSIKLANLTLRKKRFLLPTKKINAELHELTKEDLPMIEALNNRLKFKGDNSKLCKFICLDFIESVKYHSKTPIVFVVKQKENVLAMCKAHLNKNLIYLEMISKLTNSKSLKGCGTSLIVQAIELAKKLKCRKVETSPCLEAGIQFCQKLGLRENPKSTVRGAFEIYAPKFDAFLTKFKPKHFVEK